MLTYEEKKSEFEKSIWWAATDKKKVWFRKNNKISMTFTLHGNGVVFHKPHIFHQQRHSLTSQSSNAFFSTYVNIIARFSDPDRGIDPGRGEGQRVRGSIGSNRGSTGGIDPVYI